MLNKNLLRAFVVVSTVLSSGTSLCAYTYKQLDNLSEVQNLFPGDEAIQKLTDQFMSSGDNAGNLFKAYYFAVNLDKKAAQELKKGAKGLDLMTPGIAAYAIVKGIAGLLEKVQTNPQIASNIIDACFAGDLQSDGSILRGFLSAQDPQVYITNTVFDYPSLEKFRREIAIFTRNLAWSLPATYAKWQIWQDNFAKMDQKASNRSVQR